MSSRHPEWPEIVRDPRYERELNAINADVKEKAQAEHALDFALARDPERGFPLPGTPYRVWPIYIEGREYVVYYRATERVIYLDSLIQGVNP